MSLADTPTDRPAGRRPRGRKGLIIAAATALAVDRGLDSVSLEAVA
jgi:AcrR family transcriptional regulator